MHDLCNSGLAYKSPLHWQLALINIHMLWAWPASRGEMDEKGELRYFVDKKAAYTTDRLHHAAISLHGKVPSGGLRRRSFPACLSSLPPDCDTRPPTSPGPNTTQIYRVARQKHTHSPIYHYI